MNNRDVKELLRKRAESVRINDYCDDIIRRANPPRKPVAEPRKKKKGFAIALIATCCVAIICAVSTLIVLKPFSADEPTTVLRQEKPQKVFSREMLALGNAVAGWAEMYTTLSGNVFMPVNAAFVSDKNEDAKDSVADDENEDGDGDDKETENEEDENEEDENEEDENEEDETSDEIDYEQIAKEVNRYLLTGSAFLSSDNIVTEYIYNTDREYAEYRYKMSVTYRDGEGYSVEYSAYYNETENEKGTIKTEGIFIDGTETYTLKGKRKDKNGEIETELTLYADERNYVTVKNETEIDENEYEYIYVVNGKETQTVALSIETENGESSFEMELTENGEKIECEFVWTAEGIECEYKAGGKSYEILIRASEGSYVYEFEDEKNVTLDKKGKR